MSRVLYANRLMSAGAVQQVSRQAKQLLSSGQELEANILLLRYAGRRSEKMHRKELEQWQPLQP